MTKKSLVTGGAGFIGLHLTKKLSENQEVTVVDNFARGKKDPDFKELLEILMLNTFHQFMVRRLIGISELGKWV